MHFKNTKILKFHNFNKLIWYFITEINFIVKYDQDPPQYFLQSVFLVKSKRPTWELGSDCLGRLYWDLGVGIWKWDFSARPNFYCITDVQNQGVL